VIPKIVIGLFLLLTLVFGVGCAGATGINSGSEFSKQSNDIKTSCVNINNAKSSIVDSGKIYRTYLGKKYYYKFITVYVNSRYIYSNYVSYQGYKYSIKTTGQIKLVKSSTNRWYQYSSGSMLGGYKKTMLSYKYNSYTASKWIPWFRQVNRSFYT
jgi:hypothetical protein